MKDAVTEGIMIMISIAAKHVMGVFWRTDQLAHETVGDYVFIFYLCIYLSFKDLLLFISSLPQNNK